MAESYYHGIFTWPSGPSGVQPFGALGDTTGTTGGTQATATYVPPTSSTDVITIAGQTFTVTFNTTATQTVTDLKALLAASGILSRLITWAGTTTLIITAIAPGDSGQGIPVTSTKAHGSTGWNGLGWTFTTTGSVRWKGQGSPANSSGFGAVVTGVGYGINMDPVKARLSDGTVVSHQVGSGLDVQAAAQFAAARLQSTATQSTATYTMPTTSTATCVINLVSFTATAGAGQNLCNAIAKSSVGGLVNCVMLTATSMLVTATAIGTAGDGITTTTDGANSAAFSAATTTGGALPTSDTVLGVVQDGVNLTPATAGTVGSTLIATTATYVPPTTSTDTLFINGVPILVTFNTSATQTVTDTKALIAASAAINNLVVATGTTTLVLTLRKGGALGQSTTVTSTGLNGASVSVAPHLGGTAVKGVRLVLSTGTVANTAAIITGWLNETGGTMASGYVAVGRAS